MNKYFFFSLLSLLLLAGCSDFFSTDSDSVIKTDDQTYKDEIEARSGLFGLLQGMQTITDSYVLTGELRGDLMATTSKSSQELHDIAEFQTKADNSYLSQRKAYALINDCNYYIQHLDTTATQLQSGVNTKFLYPYLAQAKAIRDYTYLNVCLDYGQVEYTDKPIIDGSVKPSTTTMNLDALLPVLITDMEQALSLLPEASGNASDWKAGAGDPGFTSSPNYDSYAATQLLLPLHFVLGELYMWHEDFAKAAAAYYYLIRNDHLQMVNYRNTYSDNGLTVSTKNWSRQFSGFGSSDILSAVVFSKDNQEVTSKLPIMAGADYTIAPSQALIDIFDAQTYYTNRPISGDLRGLYGTYYYASGANNENASRAVISKYNNMYASQRFYVPTCRSALIYLRYAEAVNRLGKPRFAFNGFLKYGLCAYNINLYKGREGLGDEVTNEPWMDFGQNNPEGAVAAIFKGNSLGFHARGCGNTDMNDAYRIEPQATLEDSVMWVEDQLVTEYALETALEGNRFHDLMRISRYRHDASYLASKVAAKFSGADRTRIFTLLSDEKNWYLPQETK
ncbi:MAG: RagB/SusD family nutrient uptake outer membrane protein [Prevotella sp.]